MLTLQQLKDMKPEQMIAKGIANDPRLVRDIELKWVAVRGDIHDWTIYYHQSAMSDYYVESHGDKCVTKEVIRELVSCDDEAFKMYRY